VNQNLYVLIQNTLLKNPDQAWITGNKINYESLWGIMVQLFNRRSTIDPPATEGHASFIFAVGSAATLFQALNCREFEEKRFH
jgi:hypothetical protein